MLNYFPKSDRLIFVAVIVGAVSYRVIRYGKW